MAGHSKFANTKHRKAAQDAKRTKLFTRLLREVNVAAKGGSDISTNSALRTSMLNARGAGVPKDKIEAAIVRASSNVASDAILADIRYNATVGNASIIIEVLTDNRNRTASELRTLLSKHGGRLVPSGGVEFLFDHIGTIAYSLDRCDIEQLLQLSIDSGALDVYTKGEVHIVETKLHELHKIEACISSVIGDPQSSSLIWKAKTLLLDMDAATMEHLDRVIDLIDCLDDVQGIYSNIATSA